MSSTQSQACCTQAPVAASPDSYTSKGTYTNHAGMRCYQTGSLQAKTAILLIYDIFGHTPQTLQGADILSTSTSSNPLVLSPDFFRGSPMRLEWMDPATSTPETKALADNFRATRLKPQTAASQILSPDGVLAELKTAFPSIEKWGVVGYCWGGKVASLVCQGDSLFVVGVQTSPSMLDPADADGISVPMAVLASRGEDEDKVKEYGERLRGEKVVEVFGGSVHGWMSARADLNDPDQKREYERGYAVAVQFLDRFL